MFLTFFRHPSFSCRKIARRGSQSRLTQEASNFGKSPCFQAKTERLPNLCKPPKVSAGPGANLGSLFGHCLPLARACSRIQSRGRMIDWKSQDLIWQLFTMSMRWTPLLGMRSAFFIFGFDGIGERVTGEVIRLQPGDVLLNHLGSVAMGEIAVGRVVFSFR